MVGLDYDLTAAAEYVLCNFGGEVPDVWPARCADGYQHSQDRPPATRAARSRRPCWERGGGLEYTQGSKGLRAAGGHRHKAAGLGFPRRPVGLR